MQSPRSVASTWSADSFLSEGSERDELQVLKFAAGRYRVDLSAIIGDQDATCTRARATVVEQTAMVDHVAIDNTTEVEQAGAVVEQATMVDGGRSCDGDRAAVDHATVMYDGAAYDNDDNDGEDSFGRAGRRRLSPMLINALFGEFDRRTERRWWRGSLHYGPWAP